MFKLIFVFAVACLLTSGPPANAFKIVTIQKGYSSGGPASGGGGAQPAYNPNALLQGVQGAIAGKLGTVQQAFGTKLSTIQGALAGKLSTVQSLLGRAVALKQAAHQNFVQAVTQKFSAASSGLSGLLANKPLLFHKTVNVHVAKSTASPPRPTHKTTTTTATGEAEPTTTPKPIGYRYGA